MSGAATGGREGGAGPRLSSRDALVAYERTLDCVHCGLCLPACPTYGLSGREGASPRGRIYLMRGLAEGTVTATEPVRRDLDTCLLCRACEPVCPSGVRFGEMMEFTRAEVLEPSRPATWGTRLRRLAVTRLLPFPRRVRGAAALLSLYQRGGVQRLLRRYGVLRHLSPRTALRDALLPPIAPRAERRPLPPRQDATAKRRGRVALLEGCVMPVVLGRVNHATARVLLRQGFDVVVPRARTCCGALAAHFGALDAARAAARRTIEAFAEVGAVDAVISNSAGCGALMKEYARLLEDDPGSGPDLREAARAFAARVRDVSEFLVARGLRPPQGRVLGRAAYADAFHLVHAQGVKDAPREILRAIPGLETVALDDADRCCGAAGLYSALEPETSLRLLEDKLDALERSGATMLVSGNPGCLLQWRCGVAARGLRVEVLHPVELLDRA